MFADGDLPCNTAPPTITPASEVASPPEGRILTATQGTVVRDGTHQYSHQWSAVTMRPPA